MQQDPRLLGPAFTVFSMTCAAIVIGSRLYFRYLIAPTALRRWADERGLEFRYRKLATFWYALRTRETIFGIVTIDEAGRERDGVAQIEPSRFYSMTVEACSVRVRWIEPRPEIAASPGDNRMWDEDLDRSL